MHRDDAIYITALFNTDRAVLPSAEALASTRGPVVAAIGFDAATLAQAKVHSPSHCKGSGLHDDSRISALSSGEPGSTVWLDAICLVQSVCQCCVGPVISRRIVCHRGEHMQLLFKSFWRQGLRKATASRVLPDQVPGGRF